MRRLVSTTLVLAVLTASCAALDAAPPRELFRTTDLAPADVDVFVHVERAAALRAEVTGRPLAGWIAARLEDGELPIAWTKLARALGREPDELFDQLLGEDATLLMRLPRSQAGELRTPDWVIVSRVADAATLVKPLPQVIRGPVRGLSIREVVEHDLQIGVSSEWLVIGPGAESKLFDDVVSRFGEKAVASTLAWDKSIREARDLPTPPGRGAVAAWFRHGQPMGGWSAAVMGLQGDRMVISHLARFDNAPFAAPASTRVFDLAPVQALGERSILALIEPADDSDGLLGTFLKTQVPAVALDQPVNRGARRMWIVGEADGRLAAPREDVLRPTLTRCDEVSDQNLALARLDQSMRRLCAQNEFDAPALGSVTGIDSTVAAPPWPMRYAELDADLRETLGPGLLFDDVSLNWSCIGGSQCAWAIISTHPLALGDAIKALSEPVPPQASQRGPWASAGILRGRRLAQHLRSWLTHPKLAGELAGNPVGEPGEWGGQWEPQRDLNKALAPLIQLADTIDDASWSMQRPSADRMRLDVEIRLAPPEQTALPAADEELVAQPKR